MITLTFSWHLALFVIAMIAILVGYLYMAHGTGLLGYELAAMWFLFPMWTFVILLYGGIFWW